MASSKKKISSKAFDEKFESGKDLTSYLDISKAKAHYPIQRINIDIPREILDKADREASRIGITRTSLLKMWIAQRVDQLKRESK